MSKLSLIPQEGKHFQINPIPAPFTQSGLYGLEVTMYKDGQEVATCSLSPYVSMHPAYEDPRLKIKDIEGLDQKDVVMSLLEVMVKHIQTQATEIGSDVRHTPILSGLNGLTDPVKSALLTLGYEQKDQSYHRIYTPITETS
ncbi:hypothetical protein HOC35_04030 [Candidatus Woesearchaeota archaeon]|nr:hypothetical protein [Candidatus Woesearchaeota archaeon]